MARIFITGSADGLGQLAARSLVAQGHQVVLHARSTERGRQAVEKVPGAEAVLCGSLADLEQTKKLAAEANALGRFDAVIHNAGVFQAPAKEIFAVNVLAPYMLTCLMAKPNRLIYLSSGLHMDGRAKLDNLKRDHGVNYSDSKLYVVMLSNAAARRWPDIRANAVDPGWVPTKMGGPGAPDDLQKGYETQVWLAVSKDRKTAVSGKNFYHQMEKPCNLQANDVSLQEKLLILLEEITGVSLPA